MNLLFSIFGILGALSCIIVFLIVINIIQNGKVRESSALTPAENLLSTPLEAVVVDDLLELSKSEVFQVFQQLPPVVEEELQGEFEAYNLPQGVLSPVINFITDHHFGAGKWVGKGFVLTEQVWEGYNIFQKDTTEFTRERPFKVKQTVSEIDGRSCTRLDYRELNHDFIARSMRDELRRVNSNLFLGMGMTSWGLGRLNPAHFVLVASTEFDLTSQTSQ